MRTTGLKRALVMFLVLLAQFISTSSYAQQLVSTAGRVRVFKGGLMIEGKDLQVNDESVSLTVGGQRTFLDLREIDRVDVRKSNVAKWACLSGGGCLAIGFLACSASSEEDLAEAGGDRGQCYVGSALWGMAFTAGGALIGNMNSKWEPTYYRTSSELESEEDVERAEYRQGEPSLYIALMPPRRCCGGGIGVTVKF